MEPCLAYQSPPGDADVRAELERLLEFEPLRKSPQLISFLRYVVAAQLAHQSSKIKGYTIAIDALGRDSSFDPQRDPIVRVEAVRLRRVMASYYKGVGSHDAVTITMPAGGYVPVFKWTEMPVVMVQSPPIVPTKTPSGDANRTIAYIGVALAALAGAVLVGQFGKIAFDHLLSGMFTPS